MSARSIATSHAAAAVLLVLAIAVCANGGLAVSACPGSVRSVHAPGSLVGQ